MCLEITYKLVSCFLKQQFFSCYKVPNGEATDVEMPGKSSSEEEARGGTFTAGENLMGRCYRLYCIGQVVLKILKLVKNMSGFFSEKSFI